KALQSLNPVVAIAAGVALIALGALVQSAAANIGSGGRTQAFANGGIVGGNSYSGDKLFARINSGEMVLNQKQQRNLSGMLTPGTMEPILIIPSTTIKGNDIVVSYERTMKSNNRRS